MRQGFAEQKRNISVRRRWPRRAKFANGKGKHDNSMVTTRRPSPSERERSVNLIQRLSGGRFERARDSFGVFIDNSEQHACGAVWPALVLFPIPHSSELEAKALGEGLAGQSLILPYPHDVDVGGDMDPIAFGVGLALRDRDGVVEACCDLVEGVLLAHFCFLDLSALLLKLAL